MKKERLKVENLTIRTFEQVNFFHEHERSIIQNSRFVINQGEVVSFVGSSGSGKSLVADSIVGNQDKGIEVTGDFYYEKLKMTCQERYDLTASDICYIPQSTLCLNPLLPLKKQWHYFSQAFNTPVSSFDRMLSQVGLDAKIQDFYPHQLSGGMKKKILFSFSLLTASQLIILDEPTRGLDGKSTEMIVNKIKEQCQKGTSVLMITHDLELAAEISDSILMINENKEIEQYSLEEINQTTDTIFNEMWQALPQHDFIGSV